MILELLSFACPFILASSGALFSQYAGMLALFLDGLITFSGFLTFSFTVLTDNETMGTTLAVSGYRNKQKLEKYFKDEINALEELTGLLTNKQPMEEEMRSKKIRELAEPREYLYLHFPDGHSFNSEISFLKRIRSEIDFFLKYLRD